MTPVSDSFPDEWKTIFTTPVDQTTQDKESSVSSLDFSSLYLQEEPSDTESDHSYEPSPTLTFASDPSGEEVPLTLLQEAYDPHRGNIHKYIFRCPAGVNGPDMELTLSFDDGCARRNSLPGVELRIPLTWERMKYLRSRQITVWEGSRVFILENRNRGVIKRLWRNFCYDYLLERETVKKVDTQFKKITEANFPRSPRRSKKTIF